MGNFLVFFMICNLIEMTKFLLEKLGFCVGKNAIKFIMIH